MKAIVIDMSEVLVHTAEINRNAWAIVFDEYFKISKINQAFTEHDYTTFIEGQPRYQRVNHFLHSKSLSLPYGNQSDPAGYDTACSLEKRKSKIFTHMLVEGHIKVYDKAVQKIKEWKGNGLKTAIVSCDENFKKALKLSEIMDLFDVKIDGHASRKLGLKEKPEADLYLEASKKLNLPPESCILFDDTVAGMQAGSKANFGLVVGVNRSGNRKILSENGADMVIESFDDLDLFNDPEIKAWFSQPVSPFAAEYVKIGEAVYEKTPVLFLDYDGTLTPIVQNPEDAVISNEMIEALKECSSKFTVAAVSGRDMDDLKTRINLDNLIYAGSHGFRISGPDGLFLEHEKTQEILPVLDKVEKQLRKVFSDTTENVRIERKRYAIAIQIGRAHV